MSMMPISQSYHVLTAATRYVVYAICNNHPLTTERYHRIKFEIILSGDPLKARLQHPRKEYPTKENETVVPRTILLFIEPYCITYDDNLNTYLAELSAPSAPDDDEYAPQYDVMVVEPNKTQYLTLFEAIFHAKDYPSIAVVVCDVRWLVIGYATYVGW
eukprot:521054_1